jgi:hypothetical protein
MERRMQTKRVIIGGLVGTIVTTALWLAEPWLGLPRLAVGSMLSSLLAVATAYGPVGPALGWLIHFVVGIVFAFIYATVFVGRLPGTPLLRGLLFGSVVFLLAQVVFMPAVGAGMFSRGDLSLLTGSLLGHLVFGGIVGVIYGVPVPTGGALPISNTV